MSLTIIYKKLQELKEKEKKIQDFYDPVKVHKVQHPHIQDLRDDYQEDIQNYGFSRFQFKDEKDVSVDEKDRRIQSAMPTTSLNNNRNMISPKQNNSNLAFSQNKPQSASIQRPTTAITKKSNDLQQNSGMVTFQNQLASPKQTISGSLIRPTTAHKQSFVPDATVQSEFQQSIPNTISSNTVQSMFLNSMRPMTAAAGRQNQPNQIVRNIQSANQHNQMYDTINDRIEFDHQQGDQPNYDDQEFQNYDQLNNNNEKESDGKKIIKHWKFTKKYDTNGKQAVRNQSALRKIVMDGQNGEQIEVQDEEELQEIQERAIVKRLNIQKIYISKEGEILENRENHDINMLRKYSPTERDRMNFLDSFQQQKLFLSKGDIQFKKMYAQNQQQQQTQQTLQSEHNQVSSHKLPSQQDHDQENKINKGGILNQQQQSVKFKSNNKQKQGHNIRPQTAIGFSNSSGSSSLQNHLAHSKQQSQNNKKRINSSRPQSSLSNNINESIKIFSEDEQKLFNMKKIKSAVLDIHGPNKFYSTKDYSPLEFTEWYFTNQQKRTVPEPLYDYFSSLSSKAIYIEDSTQKTQEQFIFPHLKDLLIVDDSKLRRSFNNINNSPRQDEFNNYHSEYNNNSIVQQQSLSQEKEYNSQTAHYEQEQQQQQIKPAQIKRPTTALPYSTSHNNNNNYSNQNNNNNYNYNINTHNNNTHQENNYLGQNTHYDSFQGSSYSQQQQQKLQQVNQQFLPSSQSHSQQFYKYQSNQSLGNHYTSSSQKSLNMNNNNSNKMDFAVLQKSNLPLDYSKYGSAKQGLKPKTALSKGLHSPQTNSFSYLQQLPDQHKRHLTFNQIHQHHQQHQLESIKKDNSNKKYDRSMKGFSSPMFIKGSQVKPSFGKDINHYQFNQY